MAGKEGSGIDVLCLSSTVWWKMIFPFFFFSSSKYGFLFLLQLIQQDWLLVRMNRAGYSARVCIRGLLGKKQLIQTNGLNEDTIYIVVNRYRVCGVFPYQRATLQHQRGVLSFPSVLPPSTWRQCPQVQGTVPRGCPPALPLQTPSSTLGCHLLLTYWLLSRGSHDSLLEFH